jgi:hypothetical protein
MRFSLASSKLKIPVCVPSARAPWARLAVVVARLTDTATGLGGAAATDAVEAAVAVAAAVAAAAAAVAVAVAVAVDE